MKRLMLFVCCTAMVPLAQSAAQAGVMDPIPGDPRHEQRLVFGDAGISLETLNEKQVDFVETHATKN